MSSSPWLWKKGVGGGGGGGESRGYFPGPPNFLRGPMRLLFSLSELHLHAVFFFLRFPLHCLDSMSKRLGRLISNAFTVSVDKHFDVLQTPLFN